MHSEIRLNETTPLIHCGCNAMNACSLYVFFYPTFGLNFHNAFSFSFILSIIHYYWCSVDKTNRREGDESEKNNNKMSFDIHNNKCIRIAYVSELNFKT